MSGISRIPGMSTQSLLRGDVSGAASSSGRSASLTSPPSTVTRFSTLGPQPRRVQETTNPKDQLCDTAILMLSECRNNPSAGSAYCNNAERLRRENCKDEVKNNTIGSPVFLGLFVGGPYLALSLWLLSVFIKRCCTDTQAQTGHAKRADADNPQDRDLSPSGGAGARLAERDEEKDPDYPNPYNSFTEIEVKDVLGHSNFGVLSRPNRYAYSSH